MAHIDELLFTIKREDKPTGMKGSTLLKLDCSGSEIAKRGRLIIREVALRGSVGGQAKRTPLSVLPFATKHIHISCATIFNEFDSQIQLSQPVGGASVGGGRIGTPRKATMEFTLEDNRFWGVEDLRVSVHGSLISKWKGKGKGAASKTENKKEHHKKEKEKEKGKERKKEKKERKEKKKMGNDQAGEVKQQGDEEGEREWTKKLKVIGGYKNEWCNLSTELVIAAEPKVITKAGFALYRYSWGKVDEGEETTPTTTTAITTATTTDESKEKHKEEDTQHAQQLQGDGIASPSKKKKKKKTTPPTPSKTWRSTTAREAEIAVGGQLDVDMTKLFASPPPSSSWLDVKGRGVDINNLALAHTESVPGTMLKRVSAMYMKGTGHGRGIGLANFCQMNDKLSIAMDMKWTPWTDKGLVPEVTLTSVKKGLLFPFISFCFTFSVSCSCSCSCSFSFSCSVFLFLFFFLFVFSLFLFLPFSSLFFSYHFFSY